jgi:uncharacterized protein (TIGR03437 family)
MQISSTRGKSQGLMVTSFRVFTYFAIMTGLAGSGYGQPTTLTLVGSVPTASPAQTIGVNANTVYACDTNEISVIDVTHPATPTLLATASSPTSTANTFCDVQRGDLVQLINTSQPSFLAYDVSNPTSPNQIGATTVDKDYFGPPYFDGNTAFFGMNEIDFAGGYPGMITDQSGDFVSLDVTNFSDVSVLGTTETQTHGAVSGGSFNVFNAIPYSSQLAYVASTSSQGGATQTGMGQLWVVNTSKPSAMSTVAKVNVPGTLQVFTPLFEGNTLVTIGDSGGWVQPCCGNDAFFGKVVITVFDITNPQSPEIVANVTTSYLPGPAIGRAGAVIGPHLFLFGGAIDGTDNNYFLQVDTTNPASPTITASAATASVNYTRVAGTMLYAPTDTGFQIYSIPNSVAPSISANGILNGASFQPGTVSNSWATIKGVNLSTVTDSWDNFIVNGKLPTALDGVSVTMGGKPAYVEYVSPTQINLLAPNVAPGPTVVTVRTVIGTSSTFTVTVGAEGPAFFGWPNNQVVATRQDFSLAAQAGTFSGVTTVPAKPGDTIILWGTGFGPTTPAAPVGMETPSDQTYSTSTLPTVTVDNVSATVYGAALAPGFVGLYQVAIQVPSSLADGNWPVVATIEGVSSPSGIVLTVQH